MSANFLDDRATPFDQFREGDRVLERCSGRMGTVMRVHVADFPGCEGIGRVYVEMDRDKGGMNPIIDFAPDKIERIPH